MNGRRQLAAIVLLLIGLCPICLVHADAYNYYRMQTVPKFACDLQKYRPTGDSSHHLTQLRKIEKKYTRCVSKFKGELRENRKLLKGFLDQTYDESNRQEIAGAIELINQILAMDFKHPSFELTPSQREYLDSVRPGT